jgi:hypothetical protein
MYLAEYEEPQLGGFFKKITSSIKKATLAPFKATQQVLKDPQKFIKDPKLMTKTVTKALFAAPVATLTEPIKLIKGSQGAKKATEVVAHGAAAYFTGGATLAMSAGMLAKKRQKEQQAKQQKELDDQLRTLMADTGVAPAAAPQTAVLSIAPSAASVYAAQQEQMAREAPQRYIAPREQPQQFAEPAQPATMPAWVIPAGAAAAALLAITLTTRRN